MVCLTVYLGLLFRIRELTMYRDGENVIVYLGEDRQLYFHQPGRILCRFSGRIMHHGDTKYIFLTEIPEKFDGGKVIAPPNYTIQGLS